MKSRRKTNYRITQVVQLIYKIEVQSLFFVEIKKKLIMIKSNKDKLNRLTLSA